jgi:RNA polymerase sigma-70 factor (ECF subfamily)
MLSALLPTTLFPLAPFAAAVPGPTDEPSDFERDTAALRPLVRAVIANVLRERVDHPDVEDGAHETLRRALEGRARLRDGESLRPWIVGIARHVALDVLRARRRKRAREATTIETDDDSLTPLVERMPDAGPDPYERLATAQRDERVRAALGTLSEGPRKALTMFHLEGLGYQEIAERLGVPLGTVATWVMRGRKAIASSLAAEVET